MEAYQQIKSFIYVDFAVEDVNPILHQECC